MTEQKTTTTIEVLAQMCRADNPLIRYPARDLRATFRAAPAVRHPADAGRAVAPGSAYTLSARTMYRTNQLGPGVQ
jgi:hypothetical protein